MSIRPSLPGRSVISFEKSSVIFASLSFVGEASAAALRKDGARTASPKRRKAAALATFVQGFDADADVRSIAFCGVLPLSHCAKRIELRGGLGPGTRL